MRALLGARLGAWSQQMLSWAPPGCRLPGPVSVPGFQISSPHAPITSQASEKSRHLSDIQVCPPWRPIYNIPGF